MLAVAVVGALSACGGGAVRAPVGERHPPVQRAEKAEYHVVRAGESLFSIAWQYGLDYRSLARWNGISPPYTIHPGQRLRLRPSFSGQNVKKARTSRSSRSVPRTVTSAGSHGSKSTNRSSRATKSSTTTDATAKTATATSPLHWVWPADGPILRRFDPRRPGKKGISIGGHPGDPVRAAASGRVVYSGSGLVGYGRLIIIKHNNRYLSAYGHNRRLLVKEGDYVHRGQVIARLGSSGTNRPQLHFEIRRQGRPVDPLRYLPRRR